MVTASIWWEDLGPHPSLVPRAGRKRPPETYPELHEEKGVGGSTFKELLEAALLLGEFVVDLVDVHGFEVGVAVAGARLADVHEQVLVVLWAQES